MMRMSFQPPPPREVAAGYRADHACARCSVDGIRAVSEVVVEHRGRGRFEHAGVVTVARHHLRLAPGIADFS